MGSLEHWNIPPTLPSWGVCLPCFLRHCRDGDTVVVSFQNRDRTETSDRHWAIRLIGVDCPEIHTPEGKDAHKLCVGLLEEADGDLSFWCPAPEYLINFLRNFTFDRIPGVIYLGTETTINELMRRRGYVRD